MENTLICTVFGVFIIFAYTLGLKNGQKLANKDKVEMPNINPIKSFQEIKEEKERDKKQEMYSIMLENIDNYDGTGIGQKDLPR